MYVLGTVGKCASFSFRRSSLEALYMPHTHNIIVGTLKSASHGNNNNTHGLGIHKHIYIYIYIYVCVRKLIRRVLR